MKLTVREIELAFGALNGGMAGRDGLVQRRAHAAWAVWAARAHRILLAEVQTLVATAGKIRETPPDPELTEQEVQAAQDAELRVFYEQEVELAIEPFREGALGGLEISAAEVVGLGRLLTNGGS